MYSPVERTAPVSARYPNISLWECRLDLTQPTAVSFRPDWEILHRHWSARTRGELRAHPRIAAVTDFVQSIGLNPRETPPAAQNLIQRYLLKPALDRIPELHPIVDAVNLAVAATAIPLAVFDADYICGALRLDLSKAGESFLPIGSPSARALPEGTLILRDAEKVLSWFCFRDGDAQKIRPATSKVQLLGCTVPGISDAETWGAMDIARDTLRRAYQVEVIAHEPTL